MDNSQPSQFHEVYQKQFAAADYDRQNAKQTEKEGQSSSFGDQGIGAAMYLDATKGQYTSAKINADVARKQVDVIIAPKITKDVDLDPNFLQINETGFAVPNFNKISDYANQLAEANGMPTDGYLRQYVYNQVVAEASFKAFEPEINKYFEPEREKIDAEIFEGLSLMKKSSLN